jgi:PKD repeat protein
MWVEVAREDGGMMGHRSALWRAGLLLIAIIGGLALGLRGPTPWQPSVARACGWGLPTMTANGALAVAYPASVNTTSDQPQGIFMPAYAVHQPITFREDLSYLPPDISQAQAGSLKLRWNFGDGSKWISDTASAHTYDQSGTYDILVQEYDTSSNGWTFFDSAQIQVLTALPTNAPTAKISTQATSVAADTDVTFDATGSHSADGSPLTYLWNFNNGETATGATVTHRFAEPGKGFIALIVTDKHGVKAQAIIGLVIAFSWPLKVSSTTITAGETVDFDASQSPSTSGENSPIQYRWDFGDGSPVATTGTPTTTHVYTAAGSYTVKVSVTDQSNIIGIASQNLHVTGASQNLNVTGEGVNWLLLLVGIVALLGGATLGYMAWQGRRERMALERQRSRAQEYIRAKRVNPPRRPQR